MTRTYNVLVYHKNVQEGIWACAFIHYSCQSSADVIRKRYGDIALKNIRKFGRLDYQVKKCQLDIEFLNITYICNVISKFLRFRVKNKT